MGTLNTFLIALSVAVGFLAICSWFPIYWTKRFQIVDIDKRAEIEDAYRRTLAQILGGAAIAVTFAWTWIKDRDTLELTRIQTANQQFGAAATLIAKKEDDARAAAVYSMENLVAARSDYYIPVVNTLKSVIKTHRPRPVPAGARPPKISDDVQAAVYVLGRMPRQKGPLEMQHLYLVGADFRSLQQFQGANFDGSVMFAVNFSAADLSAAMFGGTQMSDWESFGRDNWSDDVIRDWKTSKAWERVQFVALFDWATLTNATFEGMSVSGASFQHADLAGAKFILKLI
jgi:Pentapeptide repeats (8 copies)